MLFRTCDKIAFHPISRERRNTWGGGGGGQEGGSPGEKGRQVGEERAGSGRMIAN